MEKYKLNYAELNLQGDIPEFEFKKIESLIDFVDEKTYLSKPKVYLLAFGDKIIIDKSSIYLQKILQQSAGYREFHFHEYPSFEDAYKVALDMRETDELCYN
jgi:hypothetical protein